MKEKIKLVIVFILGILISVVISVYAVTVIAGSEVSYTDNKSIGASNVQDAIDGTYSKTNTLASNVNTLGTRVTALETYSNFTLTRNTTNTNSGNVYGYKVGESSYYIRMD